MFDEIDIGVVTDNRSNEIVYLPEYKYILLIMLDNVFESFVVTCSGSNPLPSDHRSLTLNVKEFADICKSV